jgi:hypothetical protein
MVSPTTGENRFPQSILAELGKMNNEKPGAKDEWPNV